MVKKKGVLRATVTQLKTKNTTTTVNPSYYSLPVRLRRIAYNKHFLSDKQYTSPKYFDCNYIVSKLEINTSKFSKGVKQRKCYSLIYMTK